MKLIKSNVPSDAEIYFQSFHPKTSSLSLFYEVVEGDGETRWGGESPIEAIQWYKSAPIGTRILVSGWESDDIDAQPVGQPLDLTDFIAAVRGGWL
jgi:hypothetical protein